MINFFSVQVRESQHLKRIQFLTLVLQIQERAREEYNFGISSWLYPYPSGAFLSSHTE